MSEIVLKIKNTDGKDEKVKIKAKNPIARRLIAGLSYRMGDLIKLGNTGELSEAEIKESPALKKMSKEQAIELIQEAFLSESPQLIEIKATKAEKEAKEDKPKDGKPKDEKPEED